MGRPPPSWAPTPTALRERLVRRRQSQKRIAAAAEAQVRADERALDSGRGAGRAAFTLGAAGRAFWRHPSPWIMAGTLLAAAVARVVIGGYEVTDLVVPLLVIGSFPLVEWVVHVVVLHWRPITLGRLTIDPLLAREHRAHHADPRDIPLVFIPPKVYLWLQPALVAVALLAFDRLGLGLTWLIAVAGVGLVYEWVHYLIHSDYRPRSAMYKAIWRNHRLHHYKNERYWFTVTTSRTADRLFGTCPDPATVEVSPTAKDLHAGVGR